MGGDSLKDTYKEPGSSKYPSIERAILIFMLISACYGLATALSDTILANYFKDAYNVDAQQRGFIEFPRELPGVLSIFALALIAPLGIIRSARITAMLFLGGILALALVRPGFSTMLLILFVYSLGMHMFMPINDSLGISLAIKGNTGKMLARFKSVTMAFSTVAGIAVFFGFRSGFFNFDTPVVVFIITAAAMLVIVFLFIFMGRALPDDFLQEKKAARAKECAKAPAHSRTPSHAPSPAHSRAHSRSLSRAHSRSPFLQNMKNNMVFRKEYMRYYVICALFGGRKQIMFVYSPWVLIELLDFKADSISMLAIIGSLIGVFFMPIVGRLIDKHGTRKVMMVEALAFIFIYIAYGSLSRWINARHEAVVLAGIGMLLVYLLNIVDKMSAQFAMVRAIYMQSLAIKKEDVTPSLTVGMGIEHVVSIIGASVCGIVWYQWGPEYVFVIAGVMSLLNLIVAMGIRVPPAAAEQEA